MDHVNRGTTITSGDVAQFVLAGLSQSASSNEILCKQRALDLCMGAADIIKAQIDCLLPENESTIKSTSILPSVKHFHMLNSSVLHYMSHYVDIKSICSLRTTSKQVDTDFNQCPLDLSLLASGKVSTLKLIQDTCFPMRRNALSTPIMKSDVNNIFANIRHGAVLFGMSTSNPTGLTDSQLRLAGFKPNQKKWLITGLNLDGSLNSLTFEPTLQSLAYFSLCPLRIIEILSENENALEIIGVAASKGLLPQLEEIICSGNWLDAKLSSIDNVTSLTKLTFENYDACNISGNLSDLCKLTLLQHLDVPKQVQGDVSSLSHLNSLEVLHFEDCMNLTGSTESLSHLTALIDLNLVGLKCTTLVNCQLCHFAELTNLLHFQTHFAEGNIEDLNLNIKMVKLDLSGSAICGNIASIQSMKLLEYIDLYDSNVHGNISCFETLINLSHIACSAMKYLFEGNISSLSNLTKLESLELSRTLIEGDISSLRKLTNLSTLCCDSSGMSGNLSSLNALTNLTRLYLNATQVSGDISSLSGLINLTVIQLSFTALTGDISSLAGLTKLAHLQLRSTEVNGDISALSRLIHLEDIDLSSTRVIGHPSSLSELPNLEDIHLGNEQGNG